MSREVCVPGALAALYPMHLRLGIFQLGGSGWVVGDPWGKEGGGGEGHSFSD